MPVKKSRWSRAILICGATFILALGAWAYIYPLIVVECTGTDLPERWSGDLMTMDFAHIYREIGRPSHSVVEREYQLWVVNYWWGRKILRIGADKCCDDTLKPSGLYYYVYIKGRYSPVYAIDMTENVIR